MSLWVKICANTTLEDAQLAVDAGADAVGFVFAPSPRRVTVDQVVRIAPRLPRTIEKIGVFVDASLEEIKNAVQACGLTGVQLHSDADAATPARLRAAVGAGVRILRVVHFGPDAVDQAATLAQDPNIDAVLVDSRTVRAVGGTGITFDWDEAQRTLFGQPDYGKRLVVAGGLNPANVADAITRLRPWGVDVVSGVELSPGKKDPDKVRAFIENARSAARTAAAVASDPNARK